MLAAATTSVSILNTAKGETVDPMRARKSKSRTTSNPPYLVFPACWTARTCQPRIGMIPT